MCSAYQIISVVCPCHGIFASNRFSFFAWDFSETESENERFVRAFFVFDFSKTKMKNKSVSFFVFDFTKEEKNRHLDSFWIHGYLWYVLPSRSVSASTYSFLFSFISHLLCLKALCRVMNGYIIDVCKVPNIWWSSFCISQSTIWNFLDKCSTFRQLKDPPCLSTINFRMTTLYFMNIRLVLPTCSYFLPLCFSSYSCMFVLDFICFICNLYETAFATCARLSTTCSITYWFPYKGSTTTSIWFSSFPDSFFGTVIYIFPFVVPYSHNSDSNDHTLFSSKKIISRILVNKSENVLNFYIALKNDDEIGFTYKNLLQLIVRAFCCLINNSKLNEVQDYLFYYKICGWRFQSPFVNLKKV